MSSFLFEGDFRRKPEQNLGGSSKHASSRDDVLQKAQDERRRRDKARKEAVALLKLQAFFRGCICRRMLYIRWREEFDENSKKAMVDEELLKQIILLNAFFDIKEETDIQRLTTLGKILLSRVESMLPLMKNDRVNLEGVKKILLKCLMCLGRSRLSAAIPLRLIETYTDPTKFEHSRNGQLSDDSAYLLVRIWIYLVDGNFFCVYRKFLEDKLPEMNSSIDTNRIIQSHDFMLLYRRVFELNNYLVGREEKNVFLRGVHVGYKDVIKYLTTKLVESLAFNVIPSSKTNGIAAYYIIPGLKSSVSWKDWLDVAETSATLPKADHTAVRHILFSTLSFFDALEFQDDSVLSLLQVLKLLKISIEPILECVQENGLSGFLGKVSNDEDDEDMDIDDDDEADKKRTENLTVFEELKLVYIAVKGVLNQSRIANHFNTFRAEEWETLSSVISTIVKLEPRSSVNDFGCFAALSFRRDFMKPLFLYIIDNASELTDDYLLSFCWFFQNLMATLHDAEFLNGIFISLKDLIAILKILKEKFCSAVMVDSHWWHSASGKSTMQAVTNILSSLHDRNTRMNFATEDVFNSVQLCNILQVETHTLHFTSLYAKSPNDVEWVDDKLFKTLRYFPFLLPFQSRIKAFNRLLELDKQDTNRPIAHTSQIEIRRSFIYEDAFEKLSPENVRDMRQPVRISLVNTVGVMEAGIDGGGLLREFLTEATKAAVDPHRGLFRCDTQNRIYPNTVAAKVLHNHVKHYYVVGRLVGKALYEQTLLELPLAAFFIQTCIHGKVYSSVDFLATLDPHLHKNLLALKTMRDLPTLGLTFTITVEELGETKEIDLKPRGKEIVVDKSNVIEYIHLVADYKINRQMQAECASFRAGLLDVIPTLRMFSWKELQTLISGSDKPIDVNDWMAHTNYGSGYSATHPTIVLFWMVVKDFDEICLRRLLKFVTSCSRPPLLGFKDLVPNFGIQSAGPTNRLPTAATCMNLLKLPEYPDSHTLKEKLLYVINADAGFELS